MMMILGLDDGGGSNGPGLGPEVDRVGGCRGMSNAILISLAMVLIVAAVWWFL